MKLTYGEKVENKETEETGAVASSCLSNKVTSKHISSRDAGLQA